MIIGEYPCCDQPLTLVLPDRQLPCFQKEACPHCGKTVWHRLSRLDPESYTEEAFLEKYHLDENNKTITVKTP